MHEDVGPARIAVLRRDRQVRDACHVVRPDVHHEPVLGEPEVDLPDAGRVAHDRMRAVGPDDVARKHRRGLVARHPVARRRLGPAPDRQRDVIVVLHDALARPPAAQLERRLRARRAIEGPLERRLVEEVVAAPARGMRGRRVDLDGRLAIGPDPGDLVDLAEVLAELVGDAESLEDPHGLAVEPERARQRVELRVALDHADTMALAREQCAQRLPDRAVADDGDVGYGRSEAHDATCSGGAGAAASAGGFGFGDAK